MGELSLTTQAPVKAAELSVIVTLGEESAAALGVPVGTTIDYAVLATWHRNPLVRAWRRLTAERPSARDVQLARRHQALVRARLEAEA